MKHINIKHLYSMLIAGMATTGMSAHDFEVNGIYYNRISGTTDAVEVTYANSNSNGGTYKGSIVIPATVDHDGTVYRVTAIGDRAFFNNRERLEGVSAVVIPEGVMSIGQYAFEYCTNLKTISIPGSVKTISDWAFADCTGLTSVVLGEGITTIGGCAFDNCNSLSAVSIPESVTSIGNSAFRRTQLSEIHLTKSVTSLGVTPFACSSLATITVDEDNPKFDSRDNCNAIIETATNTLVVGCAGTVIPQGVDKIGDSAFSISGITTLRIPSGVSTIGQDAFSRSKIQNIAIPSSVTTIGSNAFYSATSLRNVTVNQATPLSLSAMSSPFNNLNLSSATLYVPAEGLVAYQTADCWKGFGTFKTYTELVDATVELTFADGDEYVFQRTPICPEVSSLKLNGEEWEDFGIYLEFGYSNNVNVGKGIVTIKERYNDLPFNRTTVTFTISPRNLGIEDVEITGIAQSIEDSNEPDLSALTVTYQGTTLLPSTDYTVSVDTSAHTVIITFQGNYSGEAAVEYAVTNGINTLKQEHRIQAGVHDLGGVRTNRLQQGINIIGGKKVIVKFKDRK